MIDATDIDDVDLVRRMLAGDEDAFERFADAYLPALYRFASHRLRGDRELTREIVQATVCKAVAKLETFRAEATLMTWMSSICRNEIAMHFRRQGRRPREVEWTEEVEARSESQAPLPVANAEETLIENERTELVHMVLDLLPAHYSRALEWKYLDGLPVREIADRLQMGAKAAESLLTRARNAFRAHYDRNVDTVGGGRERPRIEGFRAVSE